MSLMPTGLGIDQDNLVIQWSDSTEQRIPVKSLRQRCPCANCRDRREKELSESGEKPPSIGLPILSPEEARPLTIARMEPAGNYAYTIHFSDGHSNGLFTFEFLRSFQND